MGPTSHSGWLVVLLTLLGCSNGGGDGSTGGGSSTTQAAASGTGGSTPCASHSACGPGEICVYLESTCTSCREGFEVTQKCLANACGTMPVTCGCFACPTETVCLQALEISCRYPTCTDMLKDGTESDVDCGGSSCPECPNGATCSVNTDCVSNICSPGGLCDPGSSR